MGTHSPLVAYLLARDRPRIALSFAALEALAGPLPDEAAGRARWWVAIGETACSYCSDEAWGHAGCRADPPDLATQTVTYRRIPGGGEHQEGRTMSEPWLHGQLRRHGERFRCAICDAPSRAPAYERMEGLRYAWRTGTGPATCTGAATAGGMSARRTTRWTWAPAATAPRSTIRRRASGSDGVD